MKFRYLSTLLIAASVLGCSSVEAKGDPEYSIVKKIALGGADGWDYITIDSGTHLAYIGRSNRVMVVDMNKGTLLDEIGDKMSSVHGVAIVPRLNRGFITSGGDNTVRVFNLKTREEIAQLKVGVNPDAIIYDPASKKIFVFNHGGMTASVIEPTTEKVVATIQLGGNPEAAAADGNGTVYVNIENKSQIAVIDTTKLATRAHWPLKPGTEPTGLAIDVKHGRLFAGCENKLMVIVDSDSGKVVAAVPIGAGVDGTGFDPKSQNAFSSNGHDGTLTVIHEDAPDKFRVIQTVQTQEGARTMAVDPKNGQVWVVTAKTEKAPPAKKGQKRKPKLVIPETFTAIVVGK